jgi:hypothetical protein
MRLYIPHYHRYRTDLSDGHKGGTGILHTCVNLHPLLSVEEAGGLNTDWKHWSIVCVCLQTSASREERCRHHTGLKLRANFVHLNWIQSSPVWNSQISKFSGLKLLDLFGKCNLEILAPHSSTHFVPNVGDLTREWSDPTCRNLPWFFFFCHCKSTHNKIHCQNSSC